MADVKVLYVDSDGYYAEVNAASDSIPALSFKTANYELTDTHLGNLIGGLDIGSTEHNHDGIYFRESEFVNSTAGAGDAGKPVKLAASGYVNPLIDVASLNAALDHGTLAGLGDDDHTIYTKADGTRAFSGNQSMGGNKLTSLADPTVGTDAVNLQTLQAYQQGMKPKEAVRVATTVAGTLATSFAAGQSVDGVTLVAGDRILIKNQAAAATNGIYVVQASGAPVRAVDFDSLTPIDEINNAYTAVQFGTVNAGKAYIVNSTVTTLGTDAITFVFYNAADSITASTGLTRVINDIQLADATALTGIKVLGGAISAVYDNSSIGINGSEQLYVKALGIKDSMIDFGTGASQVSAVDIPIADAGSFTAQTEVEGALQELYGLIGAVGVTYTVAAGGVTKGFPVYLSANDTVAAYGALSSTAHVVGLAESTVSASGSVKVVSKDYVATGVLSGATAGATYYWNGSALSTTIPSGSASHVWRAGYAKNATDLLVNLEFVKKNA
jgi:hypothetical protein